MPGGPSGSTGRVRSSNARRSTRRPVSRSGAHDVREVPFPEGLADLVYCRLLLAHLVDPPGVVERWTTQLALRGLVLLDELEAIDVSDPVFAAYLDQVAIPVVEAQGARLLAGPVLAAMPDPPGDASRWRPGCRNWQTTAP